MKARVGARETSQDPPLDNQPQTQNVVCLTKPQMAAALQISVRCVTNMMSRDEIAYFKIGKLVRFRVEEALKRMEETCEVNGRKNK